MKLIVSINMCIVQQSGKAAENEIAWEMLLMSFMQTAPQRKTVIDTLCFKSERKKFTI